MKKTWIWVLGIALAFSALLFAQWFLSNNGYHMMHYGYDWHMPLLHGGYNMMGFGMLFLWVTPLASLVLIGLGVAWLFRVRTATKDSK